MKQYFLILSGIILCGQLVAQDASIIYKNTVNSTVTIETNIALGSGFFVGKNMIVTNYHVIEGATVAHCYTNNDATKYEIEGYLAVDKSVDLVLLKVKNLNRPSLKFATENVLPGQKVYAIGSPEGLSASISEGIVSGLRDLDGYKLIQITAPISHGSSGGPILNSKGELIGVAVLQIKDGQNLNFVIPYSYVKLLIDFKKEYPTSITNLPISASNSENENNFNTFVDKFDGKIYKTIKIGNQVWFAQNLAYKAKSGCWAYNNDESFVSTYGYLYTWETAKNVCPNGWHLPSNEEWTQLERYLGGSDIAGEKLKSATKWDGTNTSGFSALPAGQFCGFFFGLESGAHFWTATDYDHSTAYIRSMITGGDRSFRSDPVNKTNGYSVRCLKD